MCTKNHNYLRYGPWILRYGVRQTIFCNFGPFLTILPPNNPQNQNFEKMKKVSGDVIILYMCTKNHDHMAYDIQTSIFIILGHFLPFYPTNDPENLNF